ncbi:sialidase family protein [Ramlibacter henchirensis]|uniref:sialidase family protein n=1 Tax=Ramlibacter henchirensis TaxID=204072 RepID=UPI00197E2549|nr:hypothetical protein [Ramlibacter henchirensis]
MGANRKTRVYVTATVAALWLTACGGGGGGDPAPAPANPPAAGGAPAPAPGPAPAPAPAPALGTSFAATGASDVWHSLSSSDDGQVMVAGQAGISATEAPLSFLSISTDGGQTWVENTGAGPATWIASDVSGDGQRIVAVQFGGGMVISNDRGTTFTPVAAAPSGVSYESVTITQNGSRIVAVGMDGVFFVGDVAADGTVTPVATTGVPAAADLRSVDSSADGSVMVAVGQDPVTLISTNGGTTWAALPVTVGGADVSQTQNWYRVKVSGDGNTIAMAANQFGGASGAGIYVSKDRGATFTLANALVADYSSIAMSADGGLIAATVSNNNVGAGTGQVLLSTDGGATFAPLAITGATETDWRAVTMDAAGTRMAVAAGRFLDNSKGQIYLSTGSRP